MRQVKRAFKYRFHPTDAQAAELSRTFGCVRLVYNMALEERSRAWFADRRRGFLHKLTTRLVRENQTVVIEDLAVRNLLKNGRLARAVSDASWTDPRAMLEYKCAWYGRELAVIDRWFPSSKLCGACGAVRGKLPLDVRVWACVCGAVHDRDVNAARNILAAGLAASAGGDGLRPQRESSRTGRSSAKQEPQPARVGIPRPWAGEEVDLVLSGVGRPGARVRLRSLPCNTRKIPCVRPRLERRTPPAHVGPPAGPLGGGYGGRSGGGGVRR